MMPMNVDAFFPNLETFICEYCGMESIEAENMKEFPHLKCLVLSYNLLDYLPGDLFQSSAQLEYFAVDNNPIKTIGKELFTPLTNLKSFEFKATECFPSILEADLEDKKKDVIQACDEDAAKKSARKKRSVRVHKQSEEMPETLIEECEHRFLMSDKL
jgi:hypothetical protein